MRKGSWLDWGDVIGLLEGQDLMQCVPHSWGAVWRPEAWHGGIRRTDTTRALVFDGGGAKAPPLRQLLGRQAGFSLQKDQPPQQQQASMLPHGQAPAAAVAHTAQRSDQPCGLPCVR